MVQVKLLLRMKNLKTISSVQIVKRLSLEVRLLLTLSNVTEVQPNVKSAMKLF